MFSCLSRVLAAILIAKVQILGHVVLSQRPQRISQVGWRKCAINMGAAELSPIFINILASTLHVKTAVTVRKSNRTVNHSSILDSTYCGDGVEFVPSIHWFGRHSNLSFDQTIKWAFNFGLS